MSQTFVRGIVRVILKSGTVTELLYASLEDASDAGSTLLLTESTEVKDDFGHTMALRNEELAGVILVDVLKEIEGNLARNETFRSAQNHYGERTATIHAISDIDWARPTRPVVP